MQPSSLETFFLSQIARSSEVTAREARRSRKAVEDIRMWVRRGAITAGLYGGAGVVHVTSDQWAELIASVIRNLVK